MVLDILVIIFLSGFHFWGVDLVGPTVSVVIFAIITVAKFVIFFHMLHRYNSLDETSGFHKWPRSDRDWLGIWFRQLGLLFGGAFYIGFGMLFWGGGGFSYENRQLVRMICGGIFLGSAALLFISSLVCWKRNDGLAGSALCLLLLVFLAVILGCPVGGVILNE
jgi:hypothetical protein